MLTCVLASAAILYKGYRWLSSKPVELSQPTATWLVVGYVGFFPVDVLLFSRAIAATSSNPALYAALLGAVHFLLFVTLVRLYSATYGSRRLFSGDAGVRGDSGGGDSHHRHFVPDPVLHFSAVRRGDVCRNGNAARRRLGAITTGDACSRRRSGGSSRALSLAALSVAVGAIAIGGTLFFFFPRFSAGYLGRTSLQPSLMTGFCDDVELGQIGEIKKNATVVMRVKTGKPVGYPMLRWRGIALSNFDGKRWTTQNHRAAVALPDASGWIYVGDPAQSRERPAIGLNYEILLQPVATDTIFVPANAVSLQGNFSGENHERGLAFAAVVSVPRCQRLALQSVSKLFAGALFRIFAVAADERGETARGRRRLSRRGPRAVLAASAAGSAHRRTRRSRLPRRRERLTTRPSPSKVISAAATPTR